MPNIWELPNFLMIYELPNFPDFIESVVIFVSLLLSLLKLILLHFLKSVHFCFQSF